MTERAFQQLFLTLMLAALGWAFAWLVSAAIVNFRRIRTARYIAEAHGKVLDRLATTPELLAYLEGRAGQRLFESLTMDVRNVTTRILDAIQFGVILSLLGLSLLAIRFGESDEAVRRTLLYLGVPPLAVGVGFLISAAVSYRLSRLWDLLRVDQPSPPTE